MSHQHMTNFKVEFLTNGWKYLQKSTNLKRYAHDSDVLVENISSQRLQIQP